MRCLSGCTVRLTAIMLPIFQAVAITFPALDAEGASGWDTLGRILGSMQGCGLSLHLSVTARSCFFSSSTLSVCQPTQRIPSGAPHRTTQPHPPSQRACHLQGPPHSHTFHKPTHTQLEKMKKLRWIQICMLPLYASAPSFTNAMFLEHRGFVSPKHGHSNIRNRNFLTRLSQNL